MYNKMWHKTSQGMIQTSVLLTPEFNELRKTHNIKLTEAMRVGIAVMLAERGVREYDNSLNITRLYMQAKLKAQEYAMKLAKLEDKEKGKLINAEEEFDNELGEIITKD